MPPTVSEWMPRVCPTAGILTGGTAERLGGIDKGWINLAGQPLIAHTIDRVHPQCGPILINANANLTDYRQLGPQVCPDNEGADGGPLAGIERVLRLAPTDHVLIVPVDTPLLPPDLTARLASALDTTTDMTIARTPTGPQRLHLLVRRCCLDDLAAARAEGVKSVGAWQTRLECREVDFISDEPFLNLNTPADIAAAEQQWQPI